LSTSEQNERGTLGSPIQSTETTTCEKLGAKNAVVGENQINSQNSATKLSLVAIGQFDSFAISAILKLFWIPAVKLQEEEGRGNWRTATRAQTTGQIGIGITGRTDEK